MDSCIRTSKQILSKMRRLRDRQHSLRKLVSAQPNIELGSPSFKSSHHPASGDEIVSEITAPPADAPGSKRKYGPL